MCLKIISIGLEYFKPYHSVQTNDDYYQIGILFRNYIIVLKLLVLDRIRLDAIKPKLESNYSPSSYG